jgi:hypothetical protein
VLVSVLCVLAISAVPLQAQSPFMASRHSSILLQPLAQPAPIPGIARIHVKRAVSRPSYWLEGAIGGGVLLGAATELFTYGMCRDSDSSSDGDCTSALLLGWLPGAVAGGVIGAFVGKAFPKHRGASTAP